MTGGTSTRLSAPSTAPAARVRAAAAITISPGEADGSLLSIAHSPPIMFVVPTVTAGDRHRRPTARRRAPPPGEENVPIHNWMHGLDQKRKLVDLCLPGSHDAGVYRDEAAGVKPGSSARCQYSNIWKQARDGARVFDIRVFLRTTGVLKKRRTPTMGHFFKEAKDGYGGEYGGTLISALEDAASFVQTFPSEFLIFRIGHTKCTSNVADVLREFRTRTDSKTHKMKFAQVIHRGASGNLADLQVWQLRGKLLLVFDKDFHSPNFSTDEGYYPYCKHPNIPQCGLSFCGSYRGALGTRLALKAKDQGNWSAEGSVEVAKGALAEHQKHGGKDHLLWVYWQETGGDVMQNTAAKGGMHGRLDAFLSDLRNPNSPRPNVIGH